MVPLYLCMPHRHLSNVEREEFLVRLLPHKGKLKVSKPMLFVFSLSSYVYAL